MARIAYWEGSHITVGFVPDPAMTYDGLVRFTERYVVPPEDSPFRDPVSPEVCEADEPGPLIPAEGEPTESPMDRLLGAFADAQ